ncbi:hypothetical protein P171DRAFT_236440 [Karstenula rhodostoma CBS 690.94]|uniref:Uncharacterized protein n=1 Tax=Karstenula rhodostoma CBS 690.94 TaxID=1392251 RepID=A0A9P4PS76_9PLEO|nr:hypothetical protein P171DRAFT_236440 [Karstenula rhodostoma CBS 690.94]
MEGGSEGVSETGRKEGSLVEGQSFLSRRQFGPRRRSHRQHQHQPTPREALRPGIAHAVPRPSTPSTAKPGATTLLEFHLLNRLPWPLHLFCCRNFSHLLGLLHVGRDALPLAARLADGRPTSTSDRMLRHRRMLQVAKTASASATTKHL